MSGWTSTRVAVAAAVLAQAAVLAWMAGERELITRTGHVVHLRTAPIDPRDIFRGDYVRLQYDVNSVMLEPAGASPGETARPRHEVVYTRLRPAGEGVYEAAGSTRRLPEEGPFLRGRSDDGWRFGVWRGGNATYVKYGIEQLYVEQGRGKEIEERRGTRASLQVPMEVEVAISSSGTAVIRGYRWSRLGIKLDIVRRPAPRQRNADTAAAPAPAGPPEPLSPKLRVTLVNASAAPLIIADSPDHCAFYLVPAGLGQAEALPALPVCNGVDPAARAITLAPEQAHSVELDLTEPRWHVLKDGQRVEIGALDRQARFRIEYRAPGAAIATPGFWRGRLETAAFNASGVVD